MGVLRALAARGYDGWLMVEQDSSWAPPSEAAAIGRRVLAHALATIGAESAQMSLAMTARRHCHSIAMRIRLTGGTGAA